MSDLLGGIDYQSLLETFLAESGERLNTLEETLLKLEVSPSDPELLNAIFRGMHTLKGDAAMLGFKHVAGLSHVAEDLLDRIRSGETRVNGPVISALLRSVDTLRRLLDGEGAGGPLHDDLAAHEASCHGLLTEAARAASAVLPGLAPETNPAQDITPDGGEELRTLRVEIGKLDRLLDLVGEIAVARERIRQLLRGQSETAAAEAFEDTDRLYLELQELVMNARLVPIGPSLRQQGRTVRDLAPASGKKVSLAIEDHDVEVDARVIEQLRAPLAHLVRNALDHGIEPPELRARNGKDPIGSITLRAFHHGGSIVVQVVDDGSGLDRARIQARAVERGLISEGASLSARELQRLVFSPGFSTAKTITEVSGRGVGLDAVQRSVNALRGAAEIDSTPGEGTTVSIRLPMMLTILEGFAVEAGDETFIIPRDALLECTDLPTATQDQVDLTGVLDLRGQPLPLLRLRYWFGLAGRPARESVAVVQCDGVRVGLLVDELHGATQAVVKRLPGLRTITGIFGATVLGSGRVALILDVPGLLERAFKQESLSSPAFAAHREKPTN
jgi:two-component system, chemotaxis family, sensor kinase CheA